MMRSDAEVWNELKSVKSWYHQIPIQPGITTPGINDTARVLALLDLPDDARGLRVLDVGTRDGFFAFEMERRGAEVTAVDYVPKDQTGFAVASRLLDSKVTFINANVYDLSAERLGTFDVVLFLGLLYHLPDPLEALLLLRSMCSHRLCVESQVIDQALLMPDGRMATLADVAPALTDVPLMQFYPGRSLNDDPTNYWAPNLCGLVAMLYESNFTVKSSYLRGDRAVANCVIREDAEQDYFNRIARGLFSQSESA
jgi:tRNA (mo5U34)-methyltransferase